MKKSTRLIAAAILFLATFTSSNVQAQDAQVVWTQVIHMDAEQAESGSGSKGLAILRVTADMKLTYKLLVHHIDEGDVLTNAHIHYGAPGVNGTPFIMMQTGVLSLGKNVTVQLTEMQYQELVNGTSSIYINVHTQMHPGDSIRGQIR